MNNFFYNSSDYDLFKKALRSTKNEPVIINIYSDDNSLVDNGESDAVSSNAQRKQMSSKFQASPFDKFFGPRKKRTDPLDMKDFSAWKNKNYRESEKQIDETPEETTKFSFSDYLNSRTKDKRYNSEDELRSDNQKPIDQMSSSDEGYQKFSLDSYLNKLEQQTKAKRDFAQTDDLVSDFVDYNSVSNLDKDQDENFSAVSEVGVEDIALGGEIKGDKFAFDREELDSVKARLEKMERERNNIKDKPTTKVISSNELSDIAKGDEEEDSFNFDKLGIEDDIERVNQKIDSLNKVLQVTGDEETEKPKVEHQKFVEIKKSFDDSEIKKSDENTNLVDDSVSDDAKEVIKSEDKSSEELPTLAGKDMSSGSSKSIDEGISKTETIAEKTSGDGVVKAVVIKGADADSKDLKDESSGVEADSFVDAVGMVNMDDDEGITSLDDLDLDSLLDEKSELKKTDDILTKTDMRKFTDEIVSKFSELNQEKMPTQTEYGAGYDPYMAGYNDPIDAGYNQPYIQQTTTTTTGMIDPVNQNQVGVVGVASQSQGVDQEYKKKQDELQAQLMELIEQNKRTDEEVSKKLEMAEKEKLRVAEEYENRLRELEASMQEREEAVKQQAYIEKLKNDIKFKKSENKFKLREEQIRETEKSNSQILLDSEKLKAELRNSLSESNLEMDKKLLECVNRLHKAELVKKDQKVEQLKQELKEEVEKPKAKTTPRRRTSTVKSRMRTRTPRRKIDSDIIGGINFD